MNGATGAYTTPPGLVGLPMPPANPLATTPRPTAPRPTKPASPVPRTDGVLSKPGVGEQYWKDNAWRLQGQQPLAGYWQGIQGWFTNPDQGLEGLQDLRNQIPSSSRVEDMWPEIQRMLQGSGTLGDYWNANRGTFDRPGEGERAFADNKGFFLEPGEFEKWWGANKGEFARPGAMERFNDDFRTFFANPGAAENWYIENRYDYTRPGELERGRGDVESDINRAVMMEDFFTKNRGQLENAGYTERMAQGYDPKYKTNTERLYEEGNTGLNRYYDQAYKTGARRLDEAAAAKGGFNTGAALRATGELNAELGAQQARDMAALAAEADNQRLGRDRYGLDLMQGADSSLRGRIGLGFEGAQSVDQIALQRAKSRQDLLKTIQDQRFRGLELGGQAANNAQGRAIERVGLGADTADRAQSAAMNRLISAGNFSSEAQGKAMERITTLMREAHAAQAAGEGRVKGGAEVAAKVGAEVRAIVEDLMKHGGAADKAGADRRAERAKLEQAIFDNIMAKFGMGSNIAGNVSKEGLDTFETGMSGATTAQGLEEGRYQREVDNLFRLVEHQIATYSAGMDAARREQFELEWEQIQGRIKQGELEGQAADQAIQNLFRTFSLPLSALPPAPRASDPTATYTPTQRAAYKTITDPRSNVKRDED